MHDQPMSHESATAQLQSCGDCCHDAAGPHQSSTCIVTTLTLHYSVEHTTDCPVAAYYELDSSFIRLSHGKVSITFIAVMAILYYLLG